MRQGFEGGVSSAPSQVLVLLHTTELSLRSHNAHSSLLLAKEGLLGVVGILAMQADKKLRFPSWAVIRLHGTANALLVYDFSEPGGLGEPNQEQSPRSNPHY